MRIPESLLNKLSESKQIAYAAYLNMSEVIGKVDEMHTVTQKELSAEFRGYQVQVSAISATVIGLVGAFKDDIDNIMKTGLFVLTLTVVLGITRAMLFAEKSARGIQDSYNGTIAKFDRSTNALMEYLNGEDSEERFQEAYKPQIEEVRKIENNSKPIKINRDYWTYAILGLFVLGMILITTSILDINLH